jgi:YD repeat-containing protein
MTEVAFFDAQGQPTARQGGYAKLLRTYDARNKLIEETMCDPQGQPTRDEDGYATARFDYDERGYRTVTS